VSGTNESESTNGDWERISGGIWHAVAPRPEQLGREINPTVYSVSEFNKKRTAKEHFLSQYWPA